jgi:hypothetical protein
MEAASIPQSRPRRAISSENAPLVALGVLLFAAFALFVVIATKLTFFQDTWSFLLYRRPFTLDNLMQPHNEHIVVIPLLLQQLYLALFGMSTAMPEYVVQAAMLVAAAWLVFVYARRRVGPWPAVMAAALLLFVGAAWETILWPFEICFVGPILFGTAMLLMLEREDRRGDVLACLFLLIAIAFNSLGVAFVAAGAVAVLQRPRDRPVLSRDWIIAVLRLAWIVVIPAVLYFLWYEKWGSAATGAITFDNFLTAPRYMFDCLAANLEAVAGLATNGDNTLGWGRPLAVFAIALAGFGAWRRPGVYVRVWPPLATLLLYWFLLALNHDLAREPNTSRYLYAGVALLLLVAVNLLEGVRPRPRVLMVAGAVAAVAIFSNLGVMKQGAEYLRGQAVLTKTALGVMDIARPVINPAYAPQANEIGTGTVVEIHAAFYFEAADKYGSPAWGPSQIAAAGEPTRHDADVSLASAEELKATPGSGSWSQAAPVGIKCATFEGSAGTQVPLAPGVDTVEVAPGGPAHLFLRRFAANEFPARLGAVEGASASELKIPHDEASAAYPWYLLVEAGQQARVCLPG